jgi:signal transduction histidine kinase
VGALLPELTTQPPPGRVRAALAATLHDPDLELLYWSPAGEIYVDLDGQPREPVADAGRAVSPIDGESGPLAVMIVDKVTLDEPELLRSAVAMARLALENERLQAEVRSQLAQLRSTTARIVEAGQDARRRIERDLHDGAQQRLLALSMTLGRARTRANSQADGELATFLDCAADDLQQAITELRDLARGIHPVLLTQEGLSSALQALAERAPLPVEVSAPARRFGETVESTAYFFVSEAVTNAARHSSASAVRVDVTVDGDELEVRVHDDGVGGVDEASATAGSGLLGMRDRVVAVGGRMTISSPVGDGTTLTARLPCG